MPRNNEKDEWCETYFESYQVRPRADKSCLASVVQSCAAPGSSGQVLLALGGSSYLWASPGISGQLWVALGSSWQLWAALGSSWHLWAVPGGSGQFLAALASSWQLWVAPGSSGQLWVALAATYTIQKGMKQIAWLAKSEL